MKAIAVRRHHSPGGVPEPHVETHNGGASSSRSCGSGWMGRSQEINDAGTRRLEGYDVRSPATSPSGGLEVGFNCGRRGEITVATVRRPGSSS